MCQDVENGNYTSKEIELPKIENLACSSMATGMSSVGLGSTTSLSSSVQPLSSSCLHLGKNEIEKLEIVFALMSTPHKSTLWNVFVECSGENFDPKNSKNPEYEAACSQKKKRPLAQNSTFLN